MSRRGARLTIAVLFAFVCAAAAWQYVRVDRTLAAETDNATAFERDARTLTTAIAELRGAQQGYVAAGQGMDYWTARVAKDLASLRARLDALAREAMDEGASAHLNTASATLEEFSRLDARAREYAGADQRLLASDAIYGDGFEITRAMAAEVEAARGTELSSRGVVMRRLRMQQLWLAAGLPSLGLLFLLILAFVPGAQTRQAATEPVPMSSSVLDLAPPFENRSAPSTPVIDLAAAAELCLDLARVTDTSEVRTLLDRATRVLGARGIVLWMADPEGRELVPTVAHGYPAASVARLGPILRDSDNATAAAYREARVHTVRGDVLTNGAVVVPLVTAGGCVGVMAAEVRNEREQHDEVRAVASMVAAQLATLIGVAPIAQPHAKAN